MNEQTSIDRYFNNKRKIQKNAWKSGDKKYVDYIEEYIKQLRMEEKVCKTIKIVERSREIVEN